ncbi:MAG: [FeFe] hydrogenase H-cluster radical SAM maturase HydE, partial [Firmicutes bacterium]|nr:[FeFe] hydrogenase H-cluster radical SAM maturase HydE [Bacillota bacterium]
TLEHLRQLGYQVGAGFMVGLPDQKVEDLAEDLLLLQNLDVEMAGIGPFIPHPQTPLGDKKQGTLSLTLRALAAARLLIPCAHLPATTAIRSIDPQGWLKALKAGANVLMLNLTPPVHREKYKIYPDKYSTGGTPASVRQTITELIHSLGRTVAEDRGDSPKPQFQRSECPL